MQKNILLNNCLNLLFVKSGTDIFQAEHSRPPNHLTIADYKVPQNIYKKTLQPIKMKNFKYSFLLNFII